MLDENGEPRVFYRGVRESIDKLSGIMQSKNPTRIGVFYSSNKEAANSYTFKRSEKFKPNNNERIYEVFLNIRNPYVVDGRGAYWDKLETTYAVRDRQSDNIIQSGFTSIDEAERLIGNTYLGADLLQREKELSARTIRKYDRRTKTVIYPENPLSADEEQELQEIKDIRKRYIVEQAAHTKTDTIVTEVFNGQRGTTSNGTAYDGVLFNDIYDVMAVPFKKDPIADVPVIFNPTQVKSATRNNGEYSTTDPDHYHQIIQRSQERLERRKKAEADRVASEIGEFGDKTIEQYAQHYGWRPARDTDEEVQQLLERNRRAEPAFRRLMSELQQDLGGELITRKQMKSPERIIVKANRAFGGDISKVGDVWAGTLVFDTEDEMLDAIIKFRKRNDIVHQVNRWSKPKVSTGYRDFEAHLALDDGTIVELQLQHRGMQEVKDNVGHSLYEFISNNKRNYALRDYTWQAGDLSKELYRAAMDGAYRTLTAKAKDKLRMLGENLAKASTAEEAREAIDALKKFIDKLLPAQPSSQRTSSIEPDESRHSPNLDPIADKYLYETADSVVLPLDVLIQSKQVDAHSVNKARRNMNAAGSGYKSSASR